MIRKVLTLFGVFALLLSVFAFAGGNAHASSSSFDPKVVIVIDTTHAPGQVCTLRSVTQTRTGTQSTVSHPCSDGSVWEARVILRSQALVLHKTYALLPDGAPVSTISQLATQLKNQQKAQILQHRSSQTIRPFTSCDSTTTHYQTWGYTNFSDPVNITSRVQYYVLAGPNCNRVSVESAGIHVNSFVKNRGSGTYYNDWRFDKYASATYSLSDFIFSGAGVDHWHGVNVDTQPKGYTYETWISNAQCTCQFYWSDISVN